jgi:hypothetical protein
MPSSKKDNAPAESQRNPLGRRLLVLHLAAAPGLLGAAPPPNRFSKPRPFPSPRMRIPAMVQDAAVAARVAPA